MQHFIGIVWSRNHHPLMQFELECGTDESAWRVFRRLCGILRALLGDEARRAGHATADTPGAPG